MTPAAKKVQQDSFELSSTTESYPNGFKMWLDYEFEKRSMPNGYVQALKADDTPTNKKLSFVGNSGIKFGLNALQKANEASILDMKSMVAEGGGLAAVQSKVSLDGKEINLEPDYQKENTTQLLTGVLYNSPLDSKVVQLGTNPVNKTNVGALLASNTGLANTQMILETTKNTNGTWTLSISINGTTTYLDPSFVMTSLDKLSLQSHWGSGVVFKSMKVDKK
ncbi:MAG: hypothetical protein U0930_13490 [Pirellulales bacterium]